MRVQLEQTTLRDVMLHHGRYGDYLGNYQNAIEKALKENKLPPAVDLPEDFLQFADKDLATPDKSGYSYSNLGLLLVGLSLQHLYNTQNKESKTYDELLKKYVLKPAGVETYEKHKPDEARVNPQDKVSPHITGGPAGGAWSTALDLARFGSWLGSKYNDTNSNFSHLVEEFGGEFFSGNEFSHGGSIESASAHLSHRLQNGVTITVVSDKEGLSLASNLAKTIQENILKPTPLEQATQGVENRVQETCPKGAGSIVMISNLEEGAKIVSAGSRTVEGGAIDGQTAAIIGSGTKIFTSLCSMALISQGIINKKTNQPLTLDTKVSDVFSKRQMTIFNDQEKAAELTLGMLLSHTSGLVYFADDNRDDRSGQGLGEILVKKAPGSVKFFGYPGDQIYSYSNHIGLAAAMIEIACEKPYAEVLKEAVLDPLGMNRTSYLCPNDENVLLAFVTPLPASEEIQPTSAKLEVKDPMMQGAGGLWSCMDDMAKLGNAIGRALSQKSDLMNERGHVIISKENLEKMITTQALNAPCGLAFDLEGDVVGKGGGIFGYDFKFKVDSKTGNCISMMCNHAGQGKFDRYLETSTDVLTTLNPGISLPTSSKPKRKPVVVHDLTIAECSYQFKGFSGILAFPDEFPLTRVNFNGTTLPVKQLPVEGANLIDRYLVTGDSPFQGKELHLYRKNEHLYSCFSDGLEVWSFGEIKSEHFPVISAEAIHNQFNKASGDYIDTTPGGPPLHQVQIDSKNGITLSLPDTAPSKCLITSFTETEVNFRTCIGGGPQPFAFKLMKSKDKEDWRLLLLNGETGDPAGNPLLRRI